MMMLVIGVHGMFSVVNALEAVTTLVIHDTVVALVTTRLAYLVQIAAIVLGIPALANVAAVQEPVATLS